MGANTLSIRLNHLPPLTPFTSADSIRAVHTPASAPASMGRASAPCAALWGIPGAVCAAVVVFTSPPAPARGYAARASRGLRHIGPMRALSPGGLALTRQVSPLPLRCLPSIQPPTTTWASTSLLSVTSAHRVRPHAANCSRRETLGFANMRQARRTTPPKRVRHPAGCSFASDCSPPRLTATQLSSATQAVTSCGLDFHQPDNATSRTHRNTADAYCALRALRRHRRLDQPRPVGDAGGIASSLKSYLGWCTPAVSPLPMKMKAPGRASSMKEKSSPPMSGGVLVSTLSAPATCARDRGRELGLPRVVDGHRIAALVGRLGGGAVQPAPSPPPPRPRAARSGRGPRAVSERAVPCSSAVSGITFSASPDVEHADRDDARLQRIDVARRRSTAAPSRCASRPAPGRCTRAGGRRGRPCR